jgi:LysR family glycine cleavage system transcriptional activator
MPYPSDHPTLAMLKAFDAFGKTGGVRKAAAMLGLNHAAVSRQLAALEAYVGTALIDRDGGGHQLTEQGREYHQRISDALQAISNATRALQKREDGQILLWCSPGIAYHWLGPRLPALARARDGLALEIRPMDFGPDFRTNEADCDLRFVRIGEEDRVPAECRRQRLITPRTYPVASPELARRIAADLHSASDLLDMDLLHEEDDSEWRIWFAGQGVDAPKGGLSGPHLWHAHLLLEAAKNGQGIALTNDLIAKSALESGQLVAVQPGDVSFAPIEIGSYCFTARTDRWSNRAVARLRHWLAAEIGK